MKLLQLRQFATLAETLNFHRAAERLNMAQPPLSISIRKLEEELGTPLFTRVPRGVRLTAAGEAALDDARQALFHAEQVRLAVRETIAGDRGRLRIGFVGSATYRLLPRLLPAFRARYPQIEIKLEESRTAELLEAVEVGMFDVAIVRTPVMSPTQAEIRLLETDSLYAAVARDSRFAGRRTLNLAELRDEPFVVFAQASVPSMHAITMMVCQEAGFVPQIAEQAAQLQTIICLVESGLGVALVPGVVAQHSKAVEFIEIEDNRKATTIGLGIATSVEKPEAAARRFREFAIEQLSLSAAR